MHNVTRAINDARARGCARMMANEQEIDARVRQVVDSFPDDAAKKYDQTWLRPDETPSLDLPDDIPAERLLPALRARYPGYMFGSYVACLGYDSDCTHTLNFLPK
jgi:hypothetical protein